MAGGTGVAGVAGDGVGEGGVGEGVTWFGEGVEGGVGEGRGGAVDHFPIPNDLLASEDMFKNMNTRSAIRAHVETTGTEQCREDIFRFSGGLGGGRGGGRGLRIKLGEVARRICWD